MSLLGAAERPGRWSSNSTRRARTCCSPPASDPAGSIPWQTGGLAVDSAGAIYVAGNNIGADLITTPGAFETTNPSPIPTCCYHGFVAKIAPTTAPQITVTGTGVAVYNAATFQAGGIAPNEFITLKGTGLGPATGVVPGWPRNSADRASPSAAPPLYLTYAQDGQINVLVPFRVSGLQNTTIQVQYNGQPGNTVTVPVVPSSPGIFTQSYGPGQAWMVNQDGTFNSASNPAPRGSYVAFWVTGQGLVNTTLADGAQPTGPPFPTPMLPVSVSLGGARFLPPISFLTAWSIPEKFKSTCSIPANAADRQCGSAGGDRLAGRLPGRTRPSPSSRAIQMCEPQ